MKKPTVGRIVHYYYRSWKGDTFGPYAALVTAAPPGDTRVSLTVFLNEETGKGRSRTELTVAPYSETPKAHHWSWPPREES